MDAVLHVLGASLCVLLLQAEGNVEAHVLGVGIQSSLELISIENAECAWIGRVRGGARTHSATEAQNAATAEGVGCMKVLAGG